MKTNRDFYKALERLLIEQRDKPGVSLEEYLCSLRARAGEWRSQKELLLDTVYNLPADSFFPASEDSMAERDSRADADGFAEWDSTLQQQIQDLRRMRENGQLKDEQRYFGISAPSGRRWYNFDPCAFLECGAAGSLGGWEEGDQTGRQYVPGKVAVSTADGDVVSCEPRDLDQPPEQITCLSWERFRDFLWCGQQYE